MLTHQQARDRALAALWLADRAIVLPDVPHMYSCDWRNKQP
jgi:hypothetical protein